MERQTAISILQALAQGIDPRSGEAHPADSPYQHPDTVRALFHALQVLQAAAPARTSPANAGKPWSDEEDRQLVAAFDAGTRIPVLAEQHGRSRAAIEARLIKLGKIAASAQHPPRFRIACEQAMYAVSG